MFARAFLFSVIFCIGCHDHKPDAGSPPPAPQVGAPVQPHPQFSAQGADPALDVERKEYIADAAEFTKVSPAEAEAELTKPNNSAMRDDWAAWEKKGPMTEDRIVGFYKQTLAYIWDLGAWHLYDLSKRQSDLAMVKQMQDLHAKNILDFGGGVGLNAMMMARAGLDVTLADLDSKTLDFGKFRADKHGVKMKFWKTDVEKAPPDDKYDVILCLDVLEHLPKNVLHDTVDKLIKLKTPKTVIIIHAPFGKTATHPMHLDETEDTRQQIERLRTEQPK